MEQRARLAAKGSPMPHQLTMTATPIPRTLALMEHGDLALTAIDELPKGRQPVATHLHVNSTEGWDQVIASKHARRFTEQLQPGCSAWRPVCTPAALASAGCSCAPALGWALACDRGACLQVYAAMREDLQTGGRVFVVCSRIGAGDDQDAQYRVRLLLCSAGCSRGMHTLHILCRPLHD